MIPPSKRAHGTKNQHSGFTLIEVLVTVVIMSVGLLGVAALHITSLANSFDANGRSKAVLISNDIIERMRANRTAARNGFYNVALGASLVPGTVAGDDVIAWKAQLADPILGLPQGDGSITRNAVGTAIILTIRVRWTERGSAPLTFVTQTEV